jgi:hypothetical protein
LIASPHKGSSKDKGRIEDRLGALFASSGCIDE